MRNTKTNSVFSANYEYVSVVNAAIILHHLSLISLVRLLKSLSIFLSQNPIINASQTRFPTLSHHSGFDRSNQHSDNDQHGHHDHFGDHAEAHHGPHHDRLDLIMQTLVRFSRKSLAN